MPHNCCFTQVLLYAELRDNSQGLIKLLGGEFAPTPGAGDPIELPGTTPLGGVIDGRTAPGIVAMDAAVSAALGKARVHGIGVVGTRNTHSGTGALGCVTYV